MWYNSLRVSAELWWIVERTRNKRGPGSGDEGRNRRGGRMMRLLWNNMEVESPSEHVLCELGSGGGWLARVANNKMFQTAVSASVGASCTAFVATPLDVVKTRMQTLNTHGNGLARTDGVVFKNTWDGMLKIRKMDGTQALWRGLSATLMMVVPATAMYFGCYDSIFRTVTAMDTDLSLTQTTLLAGASARIATATVFGPLELARTRIQSGAEGSRTPLRVIRRVAAEGGLRSLWSGLVPTLWRDAPFSAIYWSCYENVKRKDGFLVRNVQSPFVVYVLAGTFAGSIAATVTTPADVVKTRRQANKLSAASSEASKTFLGSLRLIVKEEGAAGLFTGLVPRLAKIAPSCAIMMTSYEMMKRVFLRIGASTDEPRS